jgi:4-amino-4-deoxy-L-arabinose transferase-like glycosyltransferase
LRNSLPAYLRTCVHAKSPYVLAIVALALAALSPRPGLTWDEPGYVAQGVQYVDWLRRALTSGAGPEDPVWAAAHPDHPPLGKLVYGVAAGSRPERVSALTAARLASALLFAVLVGLTAYVTYRCCGQMAGWLAGGSLLLTPQVLAHAQLAALDLPVTVAWLAVAVICLIGPTGWRGATLVGVLWGIALLIKVNGIFLAGPIFIGGLISRRMRWREVPAVLASAALTLWIGWPWLWTQTGPRLEAYLLDKQVRWIVPTFYLGHVYNEAYPPWHYPLVLTVATLPLAALVGIIVGTPSLAREQPRLARWVGLHLLFTLGLACLPGVPRYDGTRLFLPAFPFLAIVAGIGLERLLRHVASFRRLGWAGAWAVLVLITGSAVFGLGSASPCLLSAFSPLIGGLRGAERAGLETTFWGDAVTPELLGAIPPGALVGAAPMGIEYVRALRDAGMLPDEAVPAGEDRCDVLIVLGRKGMLKGEFLRRFETSPALAETRRGGVTLAKLLAGDPKADGNSHKFGELRD